MQDLNVLEKDLKESFVRSSGPGGQNVNKVSTCVLLQYIPMDIQVKCQSERSQYLNRLKALELLLDKIEDQKIKEELKRIQDAHKRKRQNSQRPANIKEKILKSKKYQSEKKIRRQKIKTHSFEQLG